MFFKSIVAVILLVAMFAMISEARWGKSICACRILIKIVFRFLFIAEGRFREREIRIRERDAGYFERRPRGFGRSIYGYGGIGGVGVSGFGLGATYALGTTYALAATPVLTTAITTIPVAVTNTVLLG